MATFKSEFQDLATELISDEFADFRAAFRVFKESDTYDPRTDTGGVGESHDLQAIPLEIEDAQRVFANATNDNIYLVALKAGSSQEFDTSYAAEYDGFIYSIERVADDPADAAYFFSLVGGSKQKAPQPTTRFAPNFNGISQYALLPDIALSFGSVVEFDFISPTSLISDLRLMLSNTDGFVTIVRINTDGTINAQGGSVTIDGGSDTNIPLDGLKHKIVFTSTVNINFNLVGAQSNGSGSFLRFADFPIFNVKVDDGSVYSFPMDDGWQNNPTMRNTGSGADGTFINMTEAAWQEIPL
ncbi:hypothetical protein [Pseudoalteromonas sp.]|uniref:hypothetical protein n=1 Tax=Pseudoalteromonas sp. TaxID=53249 RepID=UPI003D0BA339